MRQGSQRPAVGTASVTGHGLGTAPAANDPNGMKDAGMTRLPALGRVGLVMDEVLERYVDFATRLRMGEGLDRSEFDALLGEIERIVTAHGHVPKKLALMLIDFPIDLESGLTHLKGEQQELIRAAIDDYLEFVNELLS